MKHFLSALSILIDYSVVIRSYKKIDIYEQIWFSLSENINIFTSDFEADIYEQSYIAPDSLYEL